MDRVFRDRAQGDRGDRAEKQFPVEPLQRRPPAWPLDRALEAAQEKLALHTERAATSMRSPVPGAHRRCPAGTRILRRSHVHLAGAAASNPGETGETRERAITLCKMAYVLQLRGRFEEALTILREEVLPALEAAGDIRTRAVALGFVADILQAQGNLDRPSGSDRPKSSRSTTCRESLSTGITMGKIATILQLGASMRRLCRSCRETAMIEALGEMRELAVCLGRIAEVLHSVGRIDEAIQAENPNRSRSSSGSPLPTTLSLPREPRLAVSRAAGAGDREEAGSSSTGPWSPLAGSGCR